MNTLAILMMFALAGLSVVLILIILLQRGRGGGLAGAFGGAGGQSALGTRAGDVFTKITIGLAILWIVLACVDIYVLKSATEKFEGVAGAGETETAPALVPATSGENEVAAPVVPLGPGDEATVGPAAEAAPENEFVDPFAVDEAGPDLPANE